MQYSFYIWHKHFSYNFLVDILITAILKTLLQLAAQLTVSGQRKMEEKLNIKLTFNLQVSLKDAYFKLQLFLYIPQSTSEQSYWKFSTFVWATASVLQ